jgi:prolyl oligopeptidase
MYVRDRVDGPERVVLDPNVMQKDGSISIVSIGISNDGEYLGYGMSENGRDWTTIKVRDVNCGHDLVDTLRYSKLTAIRWTRDAKGFFYQVSELPQCYTLKLVFKTKSLSNATFLI